MLKVECESCKAPYQIDERRVPASGLRMRCPKCGQSFMVTNKGEGNSPSIPGAPPPPTKPSPKATMMGLSPPSVEPPPPSAPPKATPPRPAPPRPARPVPVVAVPPPRQPLPSDFPAALGGGMEMDLPVVAATDLPALAQPRGQADLPALAQPRAADLPALSTKQRRDDYSFDLPKPTVPDLPMVSGRPSNAPREPSAPNFGELDFELPVVAKADLPIAKPFPKPPAPRSAPPPPEFGLPAGFGDDFGNRDFGEITDLPATASDLPELSAPLPAVAAGLPQVAAGLPSVAAGLPAMPAGLPSVPAGLPTIPPSLPIIGAKGGGGAPGLPLVGAGGGDRSFGEIDLPPLPPPRAAKSKAPGGSGVTQHSVASIFGEFGELDLPKEGSQVSGLLGSEGPREPSFSGPPPAGGFSSLDFGGKSSAGSFAAPVPTSTAPQPSVSSMAAAGGTGFGELDFGSEASPRIDTNAKAAYDAPGTEIRTDLSSGPMLGGGGGGMEAALIAAPAPREPKPRHSARTKGILLRVGLGALGLSILAGASLQLTPHGAFGYLTITDTVRAKTYQAAGVSGLSQLHTRCASDNYDDSRAAVDVLGEAHRTLPRAGAVSALAAFADYSLQVRFGADPAHPSRAKSWLAEIPPKADVPYKVAALAAEAAATENWDKARKLLDDASRVLSGDPISLDLLLLRGEVELASDNPTAAIEIFKKAVERTLPPAPKAEEWAARAHFGLARAYDANGNGALATDELGATLAASKLHVGAWIRKARMQSVETNNAAAAAALAIVLDGPARTKASPKELASAYAARGWLNLETGITADARAAFEQAAKLDGRNLDALLGQGELFFREGRYTEALARFDTALASAPTVAAAIVADARAKVSLERLADAKAQLMVAREKQPKSMEVALLLGQVEARLGNLDPAERALRASLALIDATHKDAVKPFAALASFLASRGRAAEAQALLDEATKKLPPSAMLEHAFGELAESSGHYADAAKRYENAVALDPRDAATEFRLGVTYRHLRRFEEASLALDKVQAMDKEFPGLSLERGLLFQQSGDIQRAIEQFNAALAKAPGDPDLQLRVGSAYVTIGRPEDALPMLKAVLDKRSTSAEAHHFIGRAYMQRGPADRPTALRFLQQAVDLEPNNAEYHLYLGWAANEAVPIQLGLARDEFERALSLDKSLADAYWQRGTLERKEGAIEYAIRDERLALEMKPTRFEAHAALAECYEDKNELGVALGEWTRALQGNSSNPYWRFKFGRLLAERGDLGSALPHVVFAATAGENLEPRPAWVTDAEFLSGEALRKSGQPGEALRHYKRFLEIAPVAAPDRADAERAVNALSPKLPL